MKNLGTLILGFILGAIAVYFYITSSSPITSPPPTLPAPPSGTIPYQTAQELSDNWTLLRKRGNDNAAGKPDNRSSWYALQDVKDFIELAEEAAKVEMKEMNGIRLYLGVNDINEKDVKGYTTIFMVPTENDKGVNIDIPKANGLDMGTKGMPPSAAYPQ